MKKDESSNNKDIIYEIEKRFGRHTNILMEQMRHEVKTVAEGHSILAKKIDRVAEGHSILAKKIDRVGADIDEVKTDVRIIKSELHSMNMALMETSHETKDHEKRIKKVEEKVFV